MSLELRQPLPTSWSKCRLAHIVREMGGSTPSKAEPKFWNGNVPWVSPKDMKRDLIDDSIDHVTEAAVRETALKPVPLGSTLIVVRGMILAHTVPVAQTTAPVTLNQDMKALVPYGVDGAFLRWLLKASQSRLLALVEESGHGTRCLRSELWRALEVAIPPEGGQRAIADFLDEKTAAIDALIEKKERLIALLAEKRAALIHQAVTKGLDPTVPMKPSGIPWIGDIPAHWTRTVVKRGCRSIRDGSHNPPPRFPDGHHRLLSARNIQQGEFILRDDDRRMTADAFRELERSYTVRDGDVVLAVVGATTGKSAVVGPVEDVSVQRSLAILRPAVASLLPRYLHLWLESAGAQHEIGLVAGQYAAQGGIYLEDVCNLALVLPPLQEQRQTLNNLGPRLGALRSAQRKLGASANRLHEYRQALITAAVTGQLDIPGAAA